MHHPHDAFATQLAQVISRAQGSPPPSGASATQSTSAVCASSHPAKRVRAPVHDAVDPMAHEKYALSAERQPAGVAAI